MSVTSMVNNNKLITETQKEGEESVSLSRGLSRARGGQILQYHLDGNDDDDDV